MIWKIYHMHAQFEVNALQDNLKINYYLNLN